MKTSRPNRDNYSVVSTKLAQSEIPDAWVWKDRNCEWSPINVVYFQESTVYYFGSSRCRLWMHCVSRFTRHSYPSVIDMRMFLYPSQGVPRLKALRGCHVMWSQTDFPNFPFCIKNWLNFMRMFDWWINLYRSPISFFWISFIHPPESASVFFQLPWNQPWFVGSTMVQPWFHHGFPMVFGEFPMVFPGFSPGWGLHGPLWWWWVLVHGPRLHHAGGVQPHAAGRAFHSHGGTPKWLVYKGKSN